MFSTKDSVLSSHTRIKCRSKDFHFPISFNCENTIEKSVMQAHCRFPWLNFPQIALKLNLFNCTKGRTFMTSTKNDQFFYLPPSLSSTKMNNRSIVLKK